MARFYCRRAARYRNGYSRSANAEYAESGGKYPLTRAIKAVREEFPQARVKFVKRLLEDSHDGEWHHVGKYANRVNYYSTYGIIDYLMVFFSEPSCGAD